MNIDNILTLTNDTPLPEIETNTGCCLVHKLTKLIWTGKHLADDGGTDGGCHSNDGRTCIYYNIYVSNCFSVSRMLLANHIASTRTSQLSTLLEVHVVPLQQLLKLLMMKEFITLNSATASNNCVNTRCSLATASCHDSTLPTSGLALGFVIGVLDTGRARKKIQLV